MPENKLSICIILRRNICFLNEFKTGCILDEQLLSTLLSYRQHIILILLEVCVVVKAFFKRTAIQMEDYFKQKFI